MVLVAVTIDVAGGVVGGKQCADVWCLLPLWGSIVNHACAKERESLVLPPVTMLVMSWRTSSWGVASAPMASAALLLRF